MSNPVSWFEIHVENLQRAKTFYQAVFELPLTDGDCPSGEKMSVCFFQQIMRNMALVACYMKIKTFRL